MPPHPSFSQLLALPFVSILDYQSSCITYSPIQPQTTTKPDETNPANSIQFTHLTYLRNRPTQLQSHHHTIPWSHNPTVIQPHSPNDNPKLHSSILGRSIATTTFQESQYPASSISSLNTAITIVISPHCIFASSTKSSTKKRKIDRIAENYSAIHVIRKMKAEEAMGSTATWSTATSSQVGILLSRIYPCTLYIPFKYLRYTNYYSSLPRYPIHIYIFSFLHVHASSMYTHTSPQPHPLPLPPPLLPPLLPPWIHLPFHPSQRTHATSVIQHYRFKKVSRNIC